MRTRSKKRQKKAPFSPAPPQVLPASPEPNPELPPPINVCEGPTDSSDVENDSQVAQDEVAQESTNSLFVSAFQDEVVIEASETVPKYLRFDQCLQKHVFQLSRFDFNTVIEEQRLNHKETVKNMTWDKFSSASSKLLHSFCKILFSVYKYGFSVKFMRNFCAGLATKLPVCEKKYHRLKKKSANGKLDPDLTKTSKQTESFAEFLFIRLKKNSRYYVQKAAKERNEKLAIRKHNADIVAAQNRRRKNTVHLITED